MFPERYEPHREQLERALLPFEVIGKVVQMVLMETQEGISMEEIKKKNRSLFYNQSDITC